MEPCNFRLINSFARLYHHSLFQLLCGRHRLAAVKSSVKPARYRVINHIHRTATDIADILLRIVCRLECNNSRSPVIQFFICLIQFILHYRTILSDIEGKRLCILVRIRCPSQRKLSGRHHSRCILTI